MLAAEIKALVRAQFAAVFDEHPQIDIIDEFPIMPWGGAYADLAILDVATWHGYEIKSDADSLTRLRRQSFCYSQIFTFCGLIAAPRHIDHALPKIPDWWSVHELGDDAKIRTYRAGTRNPTIDPVAIAELLRRDEWRRWCLDRGAFDLLRGKRAGLAKIMAGRLTLPQLMHVVREKVKARGGGTGHGLSPESGAAAEDVLRHPEER